MKEYGTVGGAVIDPKEYEEYRESFHIPEKDPSEREYVAIAPEVEAEPAHDALAYAREVVETTIAQDDYFIEQAHQYDIDPSDTSSTDYLRFLAGFTTEYLEGNRDFFVSNYGEETYNAIKLFGTAPYAIRQQRAMDEADAHGNKGGTEHAKQTLIAFNHDMMDLIEANPKLNLNDLVEQLDLTVTHFDHAAEGYSINVLSEIARGNRTEYAFWDAATSTTNPAYRFRRGNAYEDRHGVDVVATIPGNTDLDIDLKSSLTGVREKHTGHKVSDTKRFVKTRDGKFTYAPHIQNDMFEKGSFKLDTGSRVKLRNWILEDLQKMAHS